MSKKRSIIGIILLIGTCISFSITTIAAYLADGDSARNAIIVGGNRIVIDEIYDPEPIIPGESVVKQVRIKNTGPNACYVRVMAVFSDSDIGKYTQVDWNLTDWVYNAEDGYYYYKNILEHEETTSWLFTILHFSEDLPEEMIKDVELIVYAESYQAEGHEHYKDAWTDYQLNKNHREENNK